MRGIYVLLKSLIFSLYIFYGAFSIGVGFEQVGVVGPIRRSCVMRYLQENNINKVIR